MSATKETGDVRHAPTLHETIRRAAQDANPEGRARARATMKRLLRLAFMSGMAATEADFERLYPRLLDDVLCQHTMRVMVELRDEERAAIREGGDLLKHLTAESKRDEQDS
jgi:hypothetical protein